jgi:hypothetical protein
MGSFGCIEHSKDGGKNYQAPIFSFCYLVPGSGRFYQTHVSLAKESAKRLVSSRLDQGLNKSGGACGSDESALV